MPGGVYIKLQWTGEEWYIQAQTVRGIALEDGNSRAGTGVPRGFGRSFRLSVKYVYCGQVYSHAPTAAGMGPARVSHQQQWAAVKVDGGQLDGT